MIFIATGADATGKSIGDAISIKGIEDVQQSTLDLIQDFGGKSFTDEKIVAIDDFMLWFNGLSYKSKIKIAVPSFLIPSANGLLPADLSTGSPYLKNLADLNTELIPALTTVSVNYGLIGVGNNGYVLQNASEDGAGNQGTLWSNTNFSFDVSAMNITNKDAHFGCYLKTSNKISVGTAGSFQPYIAINDTSFQAMFFESIEAPNLTIPTESEFLAIVNGNNALGDSKSYIDGQANPILDTVFDTNTERVQTTFGILSGLNSVHNDSTNAFMFGGTHLTESELTEISSEIKKLMNIVLN